MSNPSSIPVLRGSHGTVLQFTGDVLMWSRNAEEVSIPLQAIAHVRAEGRTVTVELVAPSGTAPAVHRVDGVSEAAAALFVPAVTAALPVRAEEDETVDGSTLVSTHTVPEPEDDPWQRMLRNVAIAIGGVSLALALAVGLQGEWLGVLMALLVAPLGLGLSAFGAVMVYLAYLQWYLPRYGITVEAEKAVEYTYNGTASYAYTELDGTRRHISGKSISGTPYVAYETSGTDRRAVCYSPFKVAWDMVFALGLLLAGLGVVALVVVVTGGIFLGG
ncbi:hypothetical protein OG361_19580 [Streptomyces sp. NBC_00090]|uniref:hypothetical protein n=1 Tax=Streptomyces sp. NBC_00090 TaxID=2903619 RepID=UPI00324338C5